MSRQLIILAGGAGTRLRARLGDLPKPMIPVAGKPLLEHQVELARQHGFTDLIFFVHYRADLIAAHFGDGAKFGVRIRSLTPMAGGMWWLRHKKIIFAWLYGPPSESRRTI